MTTKGRPPARRSSLAGASPVKPPEPSEAKAAAVAAPTSTQQAHDPFDAIERGPASQPVTEAVKSKPASKYPPKVSFYQDPEDTKRVRGAILHTMATEGSRSLSTFIHRAVMAEVERLEAKYNDGQPFPPVGARELPQGRPMGE